MKSIFFSLLLLCSVTVLAQNYVQLENRWQKFGKPVQVHLQEPTPAYGPTEAGWWSKDWIVEDAGDGYIRFKNRWRETYLLQNVDSGPTEADAAKPGWWSAQWKVEAAGGDFYRLKNRWRGTYLHIHNDKLECGTMTPNQWGAQWKLIGYQGGSNTTLPADEPVVDAAAPATSWLYANRGQLGNRKLNRLILPGAHDAATNNLGGTWTRNINDPFAPDTDDQKRGVSFLGEGYNKWARAQEKSVYQQLKDGIRYIDIRVCVDKSGKFKACHGLYGSSINSVINDAAKFSNENPREPFILDFNHFYDWHQKIADGKEDEAGYQGFRTSKLDELAGMIERTLGPRMAPNTLGPESTLNELIATKRPIIVTWTKPQRTAFQKQYFWAADYANTWKQGEIRRDKIHHLDKKLREHQSTKKFILLAGQITPSTEMYKNAYDFTGTYPFGLEAAAKQTNPVVLSYVANEWKSLRQNIVAIDFYNQTDLIKLCKKLNGLTVSAPKGVAKTDRDASNWGKWRLGAGSIFTTSDNEYRVEIDACHSDLDNTGTKNRITVQFWEGTERVASKYIDGPGERCTIFEKDFSVSIKTTRQITHVVVKTNGNDGYYIDQLKIFKGGNLDAHHGRDDGSGWCMSSDPNDGSGSWKNNIAGGCSATRTFQLGSK